MSDFDPIRIFNKVERTVERHERQRKMEERREAQENYRDLVQLARAGDEDDMKAFLQKHQNEFSTQQLGVAIRACKYSGSPEMRAMLFDALDERDPVAKAMINREQERLAALEAQTKSKIEEPVKQQDVIAPVALVDSLTQAANQFKELSETMNEKLAREAVEQQKLKKVEEQQKTAPVQHAVTAASVWADALKSMDDKAKTENTKRKDGRSEVDIDILVDDKGQKHVMVDGKEIKGKKDFDALLKEIPELNKQNAYQIQGADGKKMNYAQLEQELGNLSAPTFASANKSQDASKGRS